MSPSARTQRKGAGTPAQRDARHQAAMPGGTRNKDVSTLPVGGLWRGAVWGERIDSRGNLASARGPFLRSPVPRGARGPPVGCAPRVPFSTSRGAAERTPSGVAGTVALSADAVYTAEEASERARGGPGEGMTSRRPAAGAGPGGELGI